MNKKKRLLVSFKSIQLKESQRSRLDWTRSRLWQPCTAVGFPQLGAFPSDEWSEYCHWSQRGHFCNTVRPDELEDPDRVEMCKAIHNAGLLTAKQLMIDSMQIVYWFWCLLYNYIWTFWEVLQLRVTKLPVTIPLHHLPGLPLCTSARTHVTVRCLRWGRPAGWKPARRKTQQNKQLWVTGWVVGKTAWVFLDDLPKLSSQAITGGRRVTRTVEIFSFIGLTALPPPS